MTWLRIACAWAWLAGCSGAGPAGDGGGDGGAGDLGAAAPDGGAADLAPNLQIGPGVVGAGCVDARNCFQVKNAVCFHTRLFNIGYEPETPGGYCSAPCLGDAECGPNGTCKDFGEVGAFCLARCHDATTCRRGYVCRLSDEVCYPDTLDCDPTRDGFCETVVDLMGTRGPGGCLRDAYEDRGHCAPTCTLAVGSCLPDMKEKVTRHCVYLDSTVSLDLRPTRDRWRGLICQPDGLPTAGDGEMCNAFEDCLEGSECDLWPGGDRRCHPLCVQGGMPGCRADKGYACKDALRAGPGGPGLCK